MFIAINSSTGGVFIAINSSTGGVFIAINSSAGGVCIAINSSAGGVFPHQYVISRAHDQFVTKFVLRRGNCIYIPLLRTVITYQNNHTEPLFILCKV